MRRPGRPRHSNAHATTPARSPGARLAVVGIAAALVALSAAGAAVAAGQAKVDDPAGDAVDPGVGPVAGFDIVAAAHGRRGSTLRHVIRVAGSASLGDPERPGTGARIEIDTRSGRPGDCYGNARDPRGRAEYVVTPEADGGVIDCTTSGIPVMDPAARVRVSGGRIVVAFPAGAIGNPVRYRWVASTGTGETTADFAPQVGATRRPAYRTHDLRRGGGAGGSVRRCGALQQVGAGAYDIRARGVRCRVARAVARRFQDSGGDRRFAGWRCTFRETGIENGRVRCVKRRGGTRRVVTFGFGA